jgi:WD40 repeat protein
MPDVFLSYRRIDKQFVQQLVQALRDRGKDVWVDWEDIAPGSPNFNQDLLTGIEGSDALVLVLSPDYLLSEYCLAELNYAHKNNKKLIPVVYRAVPDADLPESIRTINHIFFNKEDSFEQALEKVIFALDNDLDYHKEHSRILVRAREWERQGRDQSYLLRGADLENAEAWLLEGTNKKPSASELQTEYIFSSREGANRRQRRTVGSLIIGLVISLALALAAFIGFRSAEANLNMAYTTESLFLADLSRQQHDADRYRASLLLALESLTHYPNIFNPESNHALLNALNTPPQLLLSLQQSAPLKTAQWSRDESHILLIAGPQVRLWNSTGLDTQITLTHSADVEGALWNHDESRLLTWTRSGVVSIWDPRIETAILSISYESGVKMAAWSPDESAIMVVADRVHLLDSTSGEVLANSSRAQPESGAWANISAQFLFWTGNQLVIQQYDQREEIITTRDSRTLFHDRAVVNALWSADDQYVLSWAEDNTLYLWDAASTAPVPLARMPHAGRVLGAAFSPDGRYVLSWAEGSNAYIWNITEDHFTILSPDEPESGFTGAAWMPQGDAVMTWGTDGLIRLWDLDGNGQNQFAQSRPVEGVAWNADQTQLLSWDATGQVYLWAADGTERLHFAHGSPIITAAWSADSGQILTAGTDQAAKLWTTQDNSAPSQMPVLEIESPGKGGVLWTGVNKRLVRYTNTGLLQIWDGSQTGPMSLLQSIQLPYRAGISGAAWNADFSQLLTWDNTGVISVWDISTGQLAFSISDTIIREALWSPDGRLILARATNQVRVWDVPSGALVQTLDHNRALRAALWSPDNTSIATWTNEDIVRIWDVETGAERVAIPHGQSSFGFNIQGGTWTARGDTLLTWAQSGDLSLWNATDGSLRYVIKHDSAVRGALLNVDESRILSWTKDDNTLHVWDANTGARLLALPHGQSSFGIQGARWNRDGSRILSWSSNGVVRVWDALAADATTAVLLSLQHGNTVSGALWNADESLILTWPKDSTVRVWDTADGEELFLLRHDDSALGAAWNADESRVLSWGADGSISQWVVNVDELITIGRNRGLPALNNTERQRFFLPPLP